MTIHVNPETGEASTCRAQQGKCPFGAEAHFDTTEAAHQYAEQIMEAEHGSTATVKKPVEPEPLRLTNEKWRKMLGDTYDGGLLDNDEIYKLEEAVSGDLEAARILQRLEKTNEKLAENDGKWVFRANYGTTSYEGRYSEEAHDYAEQYGEAAMHDKYPEEEFDIKLYTCSGCEQAECDGYCLEDGDVFYSDVENLKSGKGLEIYRHGYYDDNNSRLRHELLKQYIGFLDDGDTDKLLLHLEKFAAMKAVEAPTSDDVWIDVVERETGLGDKWRLPTIKSKPEHAELVVEMLHFLAMKENESK